ncbi:FadR/GntR family transcriptional regulator, partial [Candidatus Caldatribacterium sp.]|uniref:FadR/GntR family transcriptional regulator n=1 Tax=Candidatus Caldatribacterium sp. TaxID=2282143 RepID=UPI003872C9ED
MLYDIVYNTTMKMGTLFLQPLERESLVQLVLKQVKEALISGELKPGDRLPSESDLANTLGVSRGSVREALRMLEALGVVERKRGKGIFIPEKPRHAILDPLVFSLLTQQGSSTDICELRFILEPVFTALAATKATTKDLEALERMVDETEASLQQGILPLEKDIEFHRKVFSLTQNPYIEKIGNTILDLFRASMWTSMKTMPYTAVHDHRKIVEVM